MEIAAGQLVRCLRDGAQLAAEAVRRMAEEHQGERDGNHQKEHQAPLEAFGDLAILLLRITDGDGAPVVALEEDRTAVQEHVMNHVLKAGIGKVRMPLFEMPVVSFAQQLQVEMKLIGRQRPAIAGDQQLLAIGLAEGDEMDARRILQNAPAVFDDIAHVVLVEVVINSAERAGGQAFPLFGGQHGGRALEARHHHDEEHQGNAQQRNKHANQQMGEQTPAPGCIRRVGGGCGS